MTEKFHPGKFSLVLSGGGALGIAHLGVLHDLEQRGLTPGEIVGTSMGGIVGACVAVGMREREIFAHIQRFSGVFNWIQFSFSGNAVVDTRKIGALFEGMFHDTRMSGTRIPLKIIATNLKNGDKRVFDAGDDIPIKDAVLATMAIPGIFAEHAIEGDVYGDGFLCENLGVEEATFANVLAVDVLGKNAFSKTLPTNTFKTMNILEMFERSLRLLIYNQTRTSLRTNSKRVCLVEPATNGFKTFHFHKAAEIRALGLGLLDGALPAGCL
jgi:NTE family protein